MRAESLVRGFLINYSGKLRWKDAAHDLAALFMATAPTAYDHLSLLLCALHTRPPLFPFFFCWSSQLLRYFYIPSISCVLCSPVVKAVWPVCWYSVESKENQESVGGRCRKERVGNLIRKRLKVSCLSSVVMATDAKWAKKTRSTTTKTMLSLIDSCVCVCVSTRTCFLIFTTDRHDLDDDIRSKGKEVRRCRRRRRWRSVSSTQRF